MSIIPRPSAINYVPLQTALKQLEDDVPIVDVRIPEAYGESHIAGADNICVYEVAFNEQFAARFPDQNTKVILYGESDQFRAAEMAFGRLKEAGYYRVSVLEGGLDAWMRAGLTLESGLRNKWMVFPTGKLNLSVEKSALRWIGRNLANNHNGRVELKSGNLEVDGDGDVTGGEVCVDMKGITCADIQDDTMNKVLIEHLASVDFFNVGEHPEASFRLLQTERLIGGAPGQPNYRIYGEMTLRGVTRIIEFKAMVNQIPDGISFQAQVDVNRVNFGAVYGSGSLFERLGMHLVNDLVTIDLTLVFVRA
ncbi:MAG: YceI family protein [Puniceicoccaceae bacterium]